MIVGEPRDVGPINVAVGNIVSSGEKITLASLGFMVDNSQSTSIKNLQITNGSSTSTTLIQPACLKTGIKVDTDKLSKIEDDDNLLLEIKFSFNNLDCPKVDTLSIYPQNYDYFSFEATKSSGTTANNQTLFTYPIKTKKSMCFYDLAKLDSTYPIYHSSAHIDYAVPITLSFSLSNIKDSFLNSSTSYQVTYRLTTKGSN